MTLTVEFKGKAGDANLYELSTDDGRSHKFIVSHCQRMVDGEDRAFVFALAKAKMALGLSEIPEENTGTQPVA